MPILDRYDSPTLNEYRSHFKSDEEMNNIKRYITEVNEQLKGKVTLELIPDCDRKMSSIKYNSDYDHETVDSFLSHSTDGALRLDPVLLRREDNLLLIKNSDFQKICEAETAKIIQHSSSAQQSITSSGKAVA